MTVDILQPRDVQTTFNYYAPTGSDSPYIYARDPPEGTPKTNITSQAVAAVVHDARGAPEGTFGLDVSGFAWAAVPSKETAFVDEERIRTVYYPEVEAILKTYAGAKRVFIFDHTIRRPQGTGQGKTLVRGPAVGIGGVWVGGWSLMCAFVV